MMDAKPSPTLLQTLLKMENLGFIIAAGLFLVSAFYMRGVFEEHNEGAVAHLGRAYVALCLNDEAASQEVTLLSLNQTGKKNALCGDIKEFLGGKVHIYEPNESDNV